MSVSIIGAGLSGCEAALQLANHGISVTLYDQKPSTVDGAYSMCTFAELVCNNSLGPLSVEKPLGLLITELKIIGSHLIKKAFDSAINDSHYLAVNKTMFSEKVSSSISGNKNIHIVNKTITSLPEDDIIIVASGPMSDPNLLHEISFHYNMPNYFFSDSSCAVIDIESIDLSNDCIKKISDDLYSLVIPNYIFNSFSSKLADCYQKSINDPHSHGLKECQSIEKLASIGHDTLSITRFKHEGFPPNTLLLRREGALENGFIMVGCMTTMRYADQIDAFSILPGFSNVRMIKYGRMHQNTFFQTPGILNSFFQIQNNNVYIIGQLSGLDGYAPAIASGFIAAQRILLGDALLPFPSDTMMGGLANYVCNTNTVDYQPMCASYSLIQKKKNISKADNAVKSISQYKLYLEKAYDFKKL